jgi:glutamyl/glutaminyl-tRNA synthetase
LKKLSEIGERTDYFFRAPEYDRALLAWKNMTDEDVGQSLHTSILLLKSDFSSEVEEVFLKEIGTGDKGRLLWPLRVALTGKKASPGPFEIIGILGVEESCKRLRVAQKMLQ